MAAQIQASLHVLFEQGQCTPRHPLLDMYSRSLFSAHITAGGVAPSGVMRGFSESRIQANASRRVKHKRFFFFFFYFFFCFFFFFFFFFFFNKCFFFFFFPFSRAKPCYSLTPATQD